MMPSTDALRRAPGAIARPTVALSAAVVGAALALLVGGLTGAIPLALAAALMTVVAYVAFTPMHEAAHGNVAGGRAGWARLDDAVGWAMGTVLFAPYPAFRTLHLRHHGCTNDPARDPDYWVAGGSPLRVALRCWTIMPHYYAHYLFTLRQTSLRARRERTQVLVTIGVYAAILGGAALAGRLPALLALWVGPALVATGFLSLAFDYFPHRPHTAQGRYVDTTSIPGRGLEVLMLAQNYHGVHHLYPRVPFYRYRAVFEAIEDEMVAKGSVVWRAGPRPRPTAG